MEAVLSTGLTAATTVVQAAISPAGQAVLAAAGGSAIGGALKRGAEALIGGQPEKIRRMEADSATQGDEAGSQSGTAMAQPMSLLKNPTTSMTFNMVYRKTLEIPYLQDPDEGSFLVIPYNLLQWYIPPTFSGDWTANESFKETMYQRFKFQPFSINHAMLRLSNFIPISAELRALGGATVDTDVITTSYLYTGYLKGNSREIRLIAPTGQEEQTLIRHVPNLSLIHISEPTRPY